ncbi:MAG: hypothetical protein C0514_02295 [Candidatus Puniceispirillum sp.]|nr:hypothetical protein [Candidatus Puniceispirillum sp.]
MMSIKHLGRLFLSAMVATALYAQPSCASKPNKEKIPVICDLFSQENDIDYPGIQAHLHYTFKDPMLLKTALRPMLPTPLQGDKNAYDLLEFRGDAVLKLITMDRLFEILPGHIRGQMSTLCGDLVMNHWLTEYALWNLDLERYLPCPSGSYKVCDVMEALVGAVYVDGGPNGLSHARRFVTLFLDDETLHNKMQEMSKTSTRLVFTPQMTQDQKDALAKICRPERLGSTNAKSLLNELLLDLFDDRPEYTTHFEKGEDGHVLFRTHVIGAQIGKTNHGHGRTCQESEENAARQAINTLAQAPLYSTGSPSGSPNSFRVQLKEMLDFLDLKLTTRSTMEGKPHEPTIGFEYLLGEKPIGVGQGSSKAQAAEMAAGQACDAIIQLEAQKRASRHSLRDSIWTTLQANRAALQAATLAKQAAAAAARKAAKTPAVYSASSGSVLAPASVSSATASPAASIIGTAVAASVAPVTPPAPTLVTSVPTTPPAASVTNTTVVSTSAASVPAPTKTVTSQANKAKGNGKLPKQGHIQKPKPPVATGAPSVAVSPHKGKTPQYVGPKAGPRAHIKMQPQTNGAQKPGSTSSHAPVKAA